MVLIAIPQIKKTLHRYFSQELPFFDEALPDDVSLMDQGMDSMRILELILFLEEEYGITVADDEIVLHNLETIERLAEFISTKSRLA